MDAGGTSPSRRRGLLLAAVAVAVLLLGIAVRGVRHDGAPLQHLVGSPEYLPGRRELVFAPAGPPRSSFVVVLVPGGGWKSAYDVGMRPLADRLADSGYVATTLTYRTAADHSYFPAPAEDVACAADFAAQRARKLGVRHPRIVLAGHSAGGQLAAIVALRNPEFQNSCPFPASAPVGLIGMSGVYDLNAAQDLAFPLFNRSRAAAPAQWRRADPTLAVDGALRPRPLPVLLIHGLSDTDVSPDFTRHFAAALRSAGHPVTVRLLPGITHGDVYAAGTAGPPILRWLGASGPSAPGP